MMPILKTLIYRRFSTFSDAGVVVEYRKEVKNMDELRSLQASLNYQRRRLAELEEISGGPDPEHPLQRYSIQRIAWLEEQIKKIKA